MSQLVNAEVNSVVVIAVLAQNLDGDKNIKFKDTVRITEKFPVNSSLS